MTDRYLLAATIDGAGNITYTDVEFGKVIGHGNFGLYAAPLCAFDIGGGTANNVIRSLSSGASTPTTPATGTGVEVYYHGVSDLGVIIAYNRTSAAYKNLNIYSLQLGIVISGVVVATAGAGTWTIADTSSEFFGSTTRQMLNLWSTTYGVGVQASTTYFRSGGGFAWFLAGVHSNTQNDPGAGGTLLARITSNGTLVAAMNLYCGGTTDLGAFGQGSYIGWNVSGGNGEMDLVVHKGGGGGGFNFYITGNATAGTLIASLDSKGQMLAANYGVVSTDHGLVGAAVTFDFTTAGFHKALATTATACTVTLGAPAKAGTYYIWLVSPAAGTVPALTMSPVPKGAVMAWPATLGKNSLFVMAYDGTNWWNTGASVLNV